MVKRVTPDMSPADIRDLVDRGRCLQSGLPVHEGTCPGCYPRPCKGHPVIVDRCGRVLSIDVVDQERITGQMDLFGKGGR